MVSIGVSLYVLAFCRVAVGLVFAVSSIGKVRDIVQFQKTIRSFEIIPAKLDKLASMLFLSCEFVVVILVTLGGSLLFLGFLLAFCLLLLFCIALLSVLARKIQTSCNCFGASKKPVSLFDVWRNVGFILCTLGGCLALTWAKDAHSFLSPLEWALPAIGAGIFVLIWSQLGEIAHLFGQD
jgi:uncharacterized membrane protein YphA (DoxX/SURF4 family)